MSVTINLVAYLQLYADNKESVEVKGKTIKECLNDLVKQYPKMKKMIFDNDGKLQPFLSIFIDNEIAYDMPDRPVKDGSKFHILYIIGGG
jgi:molybdopterin converting factor small subunit